MGSEFEMERAGVFVTIGNDGDLLLNQAVKPAMITCIIDVENWRLFMLVCNVEIRVSLARSEEVEGHLKT